MSTERDKTVVVLDMLAGIQMFHDGTPLGDAYAEMYQAVGQLLLAGEDSQQTPAERASKFLSALYKLPEADQQVLRVLLEEVLVEDGSPASV